MTFKEELEQLVPTDMTVNEIADYLERSPTSVRNALERHGYIAGIDFAYAREVVDWQKVDWSKKNEIIARRLEKTNSHIAHMRKLYAPTEYQPKQWVDWSQVEWSRSNSDLAQELNVGRNHVAAMRKERAPETIGHNTGSKRASRFWASVDWSLSNKEIAQKYGYNPGSVKRARRMYGKPKVK